MVRKAGQQVQLVQFCCRNSGRASQQPLGNLFHFENDFHQHAKEMSTTV